MTNLVLILATYSAVFSNIIMHLTFDVERDFVDFRLNWNEKILAWS